LKKLIEIPGASSDEQQIKNFILAHIEQEKDQWAVIPTIISNSSFQDNIILVFGQPRTILIAHMDTIGFTVSYKNHLVKIGSPDLIDGTLLVGEDSLGQIEAELMINETLEGDYELKCIFEREIERGTILTFKPNFRASEEFVQSPYLDNRLGVWSALNVAKNLKDGIIVFSTYEEHGGNVITPICKFLQKKYEVNQAIIADITWITEGVEFHKGVAISMRDSYLPRKFYINQILALAKSSGIDFQLEVESSGGSDGSTLQKGDILMDWVFIGAAEDNVHTPNEIVSKYDVMCMVEMLKFLMEKL
jgi:putative aminopeptidase FrvX